MSQYDIGAELEDAIFDAIMDALDAGDVGLGGYPTLVDIEQRMDVRRESIRRAARNLEAQERIEIGETLTDVDQPGSHVNTYIPQEVEG